MVASQQGTHGLRPIQQEGNERRFGGALVWSRDASPVCSSVSGLSGTGRPVQRFQGATGEQGRGVQGSNLGLVRPRSLTVSLAAAPSVARSLTTSLPAWRMTTT